jgi:hypothetical protein
MPQKEGWYVMKGEKQLGPYPMEALQKLAEAGQLKADMWLVMAGTDASVLAATVPGLTFKAKRGPTPQKATADAGPASGILRSGKAPAAAGPVSGVLKTGRAPAAAAPAAPVVRNVRPQEKVAVECPSCRSKCQIPKPQGAANYTCPRCRQGFRAAVTSVGVMASRIAGSPTPLPGVLKR